MSCDGGQFGFQFNIKKKSNQMNIPTLFAFNWFTDFREL